MENASSRKLTGLSSEQMNIFCLKKSVECAAGFWNQTQRGEASLNLSTSESCALREKCTFATSTFQNVLISIDQQKDNETALPMFLSENIMTSYLRLALVYCAIETHEDGAENLQNEKFTSDILSVAAACLKCIDSGDNFEKLVSDFTDGAAFIFGTSTKALDLISKSASNTGCLMNIIRFGSMYINTLSSMSRKYSNRKKLYTTFCTRLLGQCIKSFEVIESSRQSGKLPSKVMPVLDDFILVLENLIEHSLFFDDKNIEDLAASAAAIEDFSKDALIPEGSPGALYRSSSTFKASYHGGFFDALGVTCLEVASIEKTISKEDSGCTGYPHGIARLLQVYTKCSYRILAASILIEQNYDFRSTESGSGSKPPSTLHERRKHSMRVLLISLALIAVVDTVYHKHLMSTIANVESTGPVTVRDEEIVRSVRWLISCLRTHKEVLKSLSSSMDETGGSSILATHDSLQGIAQRLHSLCNRSLTAASSPLLPFLSPAMLNSLFTFSESRCIGSKFLPPVMLEARSVALDCVEILASIDHRVITEPASKNTTKSVRSRTADSQLPSLVLQAISSTGASSDLSFENLTGQRLLKSKEQLLLSVITLYDDLRRMDNFVSEVRSVCHGDASVCISLFKLLGSLRVQQRLSQAFAALPVSQSELVWGALTKHTSSDGSCAASSLMDKKCQSLILRALVQATTQSSSAPTRHVVSTSPSDDTPQSCDEILQLSAQISLTNALPQGIVESMSALFRDSIATLHLLEAGLEAEAEAEVDAESIKKGTPGRGDDNHAEFLFNIMSLLLQLGAAAIVLHRDKSTLNSAGESVKGDLWLSFRQNAGASLGLRSVQVPMGAKSSGCELGCMSSAAVLLSLSAFIATCDSLKLTVAESRVGSDENEGNLGVVTSKIITGAAVDSHVVNMIAASCGESSDSSLEGTGSGAKRKRALDTSLLSPSITPTDFLLLLTRSVSIWRHLAVQSSTVCALTVAHFKEVSRSHADLKSIQRGLLLKHACLCRLMQLATVLDCPILVSGILLAVQQVVEDSNGMSTGQAVNPPAHKVRVKNAKSEVQSSNPVPRLSMSLLLHTSNGSSATGVPVCVPVPLPVGDLLSAAAESVGPGLSSCLHISACIAHHAAAVICKVLGSSTSNSPSNEILSWSAAAASNNIETVTAPDDKHTALAAACSVLLLCLKNRPNSSNKRADSSSADLAAVEKERWGEVEAQLKGILRPLLSSLGSITDSLAHTHLQTLTPVLLDFLLYRALETDRFVSVSGSKEQSTQKVLHDVCAEIALALGKNGSTPSESTLRTLVEIYRRVCSFYCSLPSEMSSSSTETAMEVREVAQSLLLIVLPKLQSASQSSSGIVFFDVCCFLAADSLRLYAKYSEDDKEGGSENGTDEFLASVSVPALPSLMDDTPIEVNGWFLLTGNILLLQRRAGNLLSVRGSLFIIERIRQAVLLAATAPTSLDGSSSCANEETLTSLSICLQGLITSVPHALRGEVGKMLVILSQKCASSVGVIDVAANSVVSSSSSSSVSVSCALLSRYVVMGVDSLLTHGGQHTGDDDSEGNSSLLSARAVLESVAVSCTSSTQMLTQPEVVLSLISALRKGITTIQQQQQRGRRKVRRTGVRGEHLESLPTDNDPQEERTHKGREHTLSVWASCCFSILSKIVPRLLKGNGGIKGTESLDSESSGLSDRSRVQISAHALNVLEQLFSCDSVGGSSLPLLGNSIGTLGALLTTSMRVILSASEATVDDKERVSTIDALNITNALRVAGRALTAASSSKELNRHAHILSASVVDMLAQRPLTPSTRELLLPGLFALFDRCKQKQRLQMFATVSAPTRAVLSDLHGTYLRDFKFTGQ